MSLIYILIAFLLVLTNAFFVAAEFGLVKLRQTRITIIEKKYGIRGRLLGNVHKKLDAYLSACQLGITLASLGLGWIGEPAFAHLFNSILSKWHHSQEVIHFISFFFSFSIISFLHIVIGELMPKSLAIRRSESISIWTASPLYCFYWLMYPAIWLLNSCSNFLLKIFKFDRIQKGEGFYSTDEIKLILNASQLSGELSKDEEEILAHTLDFRELTVTDVMRPQADIVMINENDSTSEILKTISDNHYSRYPVYNNNQHDIIGIVHVKDLFAALYKQKSIDIKSFLRPVLKVSYRLPAIDLLKEFQKGQPHFALVYKGSTNLLGFVTLDNLLRVLIGHIKDEFHPTQDDWVIAPDGSLLVRGDCSLFSLENALNTDLREEEKSATLIGLILNKLGRLPSRGEKLTFNEFTAIIQKVHGSRITEIKIIPKKRKPPN